MEVLIQWTDFDIPKTIEIKTSYGTERGYCLCFVYSFVHVGGLYLSLILHIWGKATGSIRGLYLVCLWTFKGSFWGSFPRQIQL